ncbi:MAG: sodium:proton antiporter, partial [Pirellulaceae bacterium]
MSLALLSPCTWASQDPTAPPAASDAPQADVPAAEPAITESASADESHEQAGTDAHVGEGHHDAHAMGATLPLISIAPFVALLLAIAIFPLTFGHWWEHNSNKAMVSALLSLPIIFYFLPIWTPTGQHELIDKLKEYASFMMLLGALYVISGGIYVKGSLSGTPLANTGMLGLGALLASFIGTTGASVLFIRPLLRANQTRQRKVHIVVFFIFIVSNCGGLLTPLGDPPLFLGYLKGVPFEWTMEMLWKQWLVVNLVLLVAFHLMDGYVLAKEERERPGSQLEEAMKHEPVQVLGKLNFLFLLGVVAAIYAKGQGLGMGGQEWPWGVQEGLMLAMAVAGFATTSTNNREQNRFTFGPIIEVAVLFVGIFITMAPALMILNAWGQGQRDVVGMKFGLTESWQFFWATGVLSSFLDNAPTYLTLAATACGLNNVNVEGAGYLRELLAQGESAAMLLAAISCGAVFMGANTYIGNGPNFMVKAIAEENGVKMPSFFGYMIYSG